MKHKSQSKPKGYIKQLDSGEGSPRLPKKPVQSVSGGNKIASVPRGKYIS